MMTTSRKKFDVDNRTTKDIVREIGELANNYTPEWQFSEKNPDIGSVLALLYAEQMKGNLDRFNEIVERYHMEFVNLLDISLHAAHPATATVLMNLLSDSIPDAYVPKGTKLIAEAGDENLIFETEFPVYITGSQLKSAFITNSENGSIVPVYDVFEERDFAGNIITGNDEEAAITDGMKPFYMFSDKEKGIEKQALVLYHSRIFDVENEAIYCRMRGNSEFLSQLSNGEYRFLYYTEEGFIPVESCEVKDELIILEKEKDGRKVTVEGREYDILVIEAMNPQKENKTFAEITFSSEGKWREPEFAGNASNDYVVNKFNVFTDTLSLYEECYIGLDQYFSKAGARISLKCRVDYDEHYVGFELDNGDEELKIIKRKPRISTGAMVSYAYAEEITLEYYNGTGWKRIPTEADFSRIFAEGESGELNISFICPSDWQPLSVGAFGGRTMRLVLRRSDNCYLQHSIHRYPVMSDTQIMYTYEDKYVAPEKGKVLYGSAELDITDNLLLGRSVIGFEPSNYNDTALYLGFSSTFDKGPVSFWWKLVDSHRDTNQKMHFYYSSHTGFKEMKVIDYTAGLSRSGIMLFMPPDDMAMVELEGKKRCWIKVTREGKNGSKDTVQIERVTVNAVEARNINTFAEEPYFIDTVESYMNFPLLGGNILDADVWVNEVTELSTEKMKAMLRNNPDKVRADYDSLGSIVSFFVKWSEVDNFNKSNADDRHYVIDRINNLLWFGDGVHVRIPKNTKGEAFRVKIRSCDGEKGNVPAGSIIGSMSNLMFIGDIANPVPAFGGSNMESLERAMARGANLLSSGGRFVTCKDYLSEIENYSDNIDKAAIVIGTNRYGESRDNMLYVILLMKDYKDGAASFYRMQTELRRHLLEHCEMTILPDDLVVEEPVFVEFNIDVWAQIVNIEDSFEVTNYITDALTDYLEPVSSKAGEGRPIGHIPGKTQIMMRLNALKSKAIINQMLVTVRFTDRNGVHEMDLDQLEVNPFMVACNGTHKIHIITADK